MPFLSDDDLSDLDDPDLRYVAITKEQLFRAQAEIVVCAACHPDVDTLFDAILRDVAEDKGYVDYILPHPAVCPRCQSEVHEKTLVGRIGGIDVEVESIVLQ